MEKNKKILIIVVISFLFISILALILGVSVSSNKNQDESNLVETINTPIEKWSRKITTELEASNKIVMNKFDGYQITVPENWIVSNEASFNGGLKIYYGGPDITEAPLEVSDGLLLSVITYSDRDDLKNVFSDTALFEEVSLPSGAAHITESAISYIDENNKLIEVENTRSVKYLIQKNRKFYIISCSALGGDFQELISLCKEQVQTFKITK